MVVRVFLADNNNFRACMSQKRKSYPDHILVGLICRNVISLGSLSTRACDQSEDDVLNRDKNIRFLVM